MLKEQVAEIIRPLLFEDYYPAEVQHQASLDLAQTIVNIFKADEEQIRKEERERIVDILEEEIKTWYDLARKLRILDLIKTKVCMEGEYDDKKKDAMLKALGRE